MKYIFIKDFYNYFKYHKKIWISYIVIIFLSILFGNLIGLQLKDSIAMSLGLNCSPNSGILEIIMYILNIGFYILPVLLVINTDIKFNADNLFLRIDLKKWLYGKILSIIIILFVQKIITFIVIAAICLFYNYTPFGFIDVFINNYLLILFIQLLFFMVYIISSYSKRIIIFFILVLLLLIKYLFINSYTVNKVLIMFLIITVCILILFLKNKINNLFENVGGN